MYRSLPKLAAAIASPDTYTVQDTEDEHNRLESVTDEQAMGMVYSAHGTYTVTNDRTQTRSTYIYS